MKPVRWTVAAVLLLGCGMRQNFSGDYAGSVEATAMDPDGGRRRVTAGETWVVRSGDSSWPAKSSYHLAITRTGEAACELAGARGAGYQMDLAAGQTCVRDGVTVTLDEGSFHGRDNVNVALMWSLPSGGKLKEEGTLTMKK